MTTNNDSHSKVSTRKQSAQRGRGVWSSNQAFSLPQEAWYLVQEDLTKSELKVTLCILLNYFQVGIDAEPLTFTDILNQCSIPKSSVWAGLKAALKRGSIYRSNQQTYEPRFKKRNMSCNTITTNSSNSEHGLKTCHGSEIEPRQQIFSQLLKFGLAYHVAENIAMTNRYALDRLQNQLNYIAHELENNQAPQGDKFPGYVVNRIKYDRQPPPGFKANGAWYAGHEELIVR